MRRRDGGRPDGMQTTSRRDDDWRADWANFLGLEGRGQYLELSWPLPPSLLQPTEVIFTARAMCSSGSEGEGKGSRVIRRREPEASGRSERGIILSTVYYGRYVRVPLAVPVPVPVGTSTNTSTVGKNALPIRRGPLGVMASQSHHRENERDALYQMESPFCQHWSLLPTASYE